MTATTHALTAGATITCSHLNTITPAGVPALTVDRKPVHVQGVATVVCAASGPSITPCGAVTVAPGAAATALTAGHLPVLLAEPFSATTTTGAPSAVLVVETQTVLRAQ